MKKVLNRKKTATLFITLSVFVFLSVFTTGFINAETQERYNVKLNVKPFNSNYICNFDIVDINTGKLISSPKVICADGQKAVIRTEGTYQINANILIMKELSSIDYSMKIEKSHKVIFVQEANINF